MRDVNDECMSMRNFLYDFYNVYISIILLNDI